MGSTIYLLITTAISNPDDDGNDGGVNDPLDDLRWFTDGDEAIAAAKAIVNDLVSEDGVEAHVTGERGEWWEVTTSFNIHHIRVERFDEVDLR